MSRRPARTRPAASPLSYSGSGRASAGTMILAFVFAVVAAAMIAAPIVRAAAR
ncbi:MAG: hypothetical protein M0D55_18315 [Elusimicrobiota bacterium]|nr:MAG: hypothetical protein M0D55_18315 [Elusimicrobiota bacterium]